MSALAAELIYNGTFESGNDGTWTANTLSGSTAADVVSLSYPHLDLWYGYVGNSVNSIGSLYQIMYVPADAGVVSVTFYLNVGSAETTTTRSYDVMDVNFRTYPGDQLIRKLATFSNLDKAADGAYTKMGPFTYDLTAYQSGFVIFQFYATNDSSQITIFRVDDVSVQYTSALMPDLTPYQPANWNDIIPIGTTALASTATNNYAGSYYDNQTLYFNWGSLNQGNATASAYTVHLQVTGTGGGSSDWPGYTTPAGYWSFLPTDQAVGPLAAGSHTFKLWLDYNNTVAEGDETNNYYERTITVLPSTETITVPGTISGQANPIQNVSYTYTVGAATSSLGHTVQYSFDWGDGNASSFSTSTSASHAWSSTGQKSIVVTARCQTDTAVSNNNSPGKSVTVAPSGQVPIAFLYGDARPVTGSRVTYYGDLSLGTAPLTYAWRTSDGQSKIGSSSTAQFTFNSPGQYTVYLAVTDATGNTSPEASGAIIVQAANNGSIPGQPTSPDPVVLSSGNYIQERVDLKMAGRGFPFEFKRFYNSKFGDQTGRPLGFGWTHSYNERIKDNGTNALVIRGDGSTWEFTQSGGIYAPEPGVFDSLVHNGDGTWSLTDKDQTVKRFASTNNLISITDKNGNTLNLYYLGGVLRQIQDTAGRTNLINTNGFGCISDITDASGRTVRYQYDSQTNLVWVIDANGQASTNRYTVGFHQLTDAFDPKGNRFVHNEYDTNSFVVLRQCDALTNWTYFAYNFTNRITYQTNAFGKYSIHFFDHRLLETNSVDEAGSTQAFAYDTNRNRILVQDKRGIPTSYGYDLRGNVTNKKDALTNLTTIQYDANNHPTRRTDSLTQSTAFGYDGHGNLTQTTNALNQMSLVEYNAFGQPIILTDANNHKTTNTFDLQGNLVMVQDALGNITTFGYDPVGRKIAQTNANNQVTRYFYDNNDNLLRTVDPLGATNSSIYDSNNNRIVSIDPRGATTTNTFDAKDRLIAVRDAMGGITRYEFDALDRKTKITDPRNGITQFVYNEVGNVLAVTNALNQVTRYTYDVNGNKTSVINPLGQITTNIFDALNRLVMTVDPLNHSNRTVYDALGRRVQAIDALNRTNQFVYDLVGRLAQVTDANGGTVKFYYDQVGNRLVTTDPNNHSTTNTFDDLNRLVQTREPGGGVYQFFYDRVGNCTNQVDPNLSNINYSYDGNNRRTVIAYPTGSPVIFRYDANGNRTNMVDNLGTTTYQFDSLNRLVGVTDPFGQTVSSGYDANGNRTSLTYPAGKTVNYGYDALNRMVAVTNWLNGVTTYTYDPVGNLTNALNPNATRVDHAFDTARRLIALTNSGPASAIISSYAYTLDALGSHRQVNWVEPTPVMPDVQSADFTYDSDNRMVATGGQPQTFDSNGNMLSMAPTKSLVYDYENRLTATVFDGKTNSYQYDGAGNRLWASRDGMVTRYVLDRSSALTQVLAEMSFAGNPIAYYVYGLGLISRIETGTNSQYYHFDSRGSTIALTDANGQVIDTYTYDPFGTVGAFSGHTDNRFRYLGRHGIQDEDNGLNFVRARYYSANHLRFISKDPTSGKDGDSQSLNRYIYGQNNPVKLIDISGLSAKEVTLVFGSSDPFLQLYDALVNSGCPAYLLEDVRRCRLDVPPGASVDANIAFVQDLWFM